jgi:hypothetical protein
MSGLLHDIASAMGGKVSGDRAIFPTPGHSKRDLGSWATLKPGAPDGVLIHCSNGGDPLAIKDELRSRGILPQRGANDDPTPWRPPVREAALALQHAVKLAAGQVIVATFEFYGSDGALLHRKHRIEPGKDGRKKTFSFDRPDGRGGWLLGQGDDRVPYRLPDLIAAPRGVPIFMAEGEAKADRLVELGFLATSHKDWKSFEFSGYVRGRTVFILPDNDETGRRLAESAREAVETAGGTAYLIELSGLGEGEDVLDWTGTAEDLRSLSDRAAAGADRTLPALDLAELSKTKAQPRRFAVERIAPVAEVSLFSGAGSGGKSLFGQQMATASAAALGVCLGLSVQPGPAMYVTCEDGADQLHWVQEHICSRYGLNMADLAGHLHLVSLRGELENALGTFDARGILRPSSMFERLALTIEQTGVHLVFLDNVGHLYTGNENDRGQVTQFVNLLNRLAERTGAAIILLGHPSKGST